MSASPCLRIAFVCTGNICRSPLAEALARAHAENAGLADSVAFESFGTHGYHIGEGADPRTVATARRFGVDLGSHRARQIVAGDCAQVDLLLAMDAGHERFLQRLAAPAGVPALLYLPWLGVQTAVDVPDPYYGDAEGFLAVHRLLDHAAERLVGRLPALIAGGDV